ncbi:hypothetical protein D3C87_1432860 [compost metagenome]
MIEALGRLRELGAIQDTGRRAGDNRSSIIYRLCPNAVPVINFATSCSVAGGESQTGQQDLALQDGTEDAPSAAPADDDPPTVHQRQSSDQDGSRLGYLPDTLVGSPAFSCGDAPPLNCGEMPGGSPQADDMAEAGDPSPADVRLPNSALARVPTGKAAKGAKKKGRRRQPEARAACAGPTGLPATWRLPERWRSWTQAQRPLWTHEKIDAMAATFSAYMRSRPGELGMSPDWFESWRLWVFRERDAQGAAGTAWQDSWTGIVATGKKLGVEQAPNEPPPHFKARVFQAAGLLPSH